MKMSPKQVLTSTNHFLGVWLGKPSKLEHGKAWEKFPTGSSEKRGGFKIPQLVPKFTKFPTSTGGGGQQRLGIFPKFYHVRVLKASLNKTKCESMGPKQG